MNRERAYYPRDDAPIAGGDLAWSGVNGFLQPAQLPPGDLADGRNFRCEQGIVRTRPGTTRVLWANNTTLDGKIVPWPDVLAAPVQFKEPNGAEWTVWASTPEAYATRANNAPRPVPLPPGVDLIARVSFVQAFNRLYLDRDHGNSLVLDDLDIGFVDAVPHWDSTVAYGATDLVMWGQWIPVVAFDVVSGIATFVTGLPHQLGTGQDVRIRNATVALLLNGRRTATFIDEATFTCPMEIADGNYLTPTTQASPVDFGWRRADSVVLTASSVSHAGTVATFTTATPHGLNPNDVVLVAGATDPFYNGSQTITFVSPTSFRYNMSGTPAVDTGAPTITATLTAMVAGGEPGVHPGWVRDYTVMPAGIHGCYVNNRRLLPTRWNPSADLLSGAYAGRRDFVAASYITDNSRFTVANEFRINQGSADELLQAIKLGPSSVVCLKSTTVWLLNNVTGDLSSLSLEMLIPNYGLANPHAVTLAGKDIFFMAPRRGIVSLTQTVNGQIQGVDQPLSRSIQPWIDRINWGLSDQIRLAYHDNKLRAAVPLDDGHADGADWFGALQYAGFYGVGTPSSLIHLVDGATYRWTPQPDSGERFSVGGAIYHEEVEFVWHTGAIVYVQQITPAGAPIPAQSSFRRVYTGCNNAVLTYDFLVGAWQPMDTGPGGGVAEWFIATCNGRERLCCFSVDMTAAIYDDCNCGLDQVYDPVSPAGVGRADIDAELVTRGYLAPEQGEKRAEFAEVVVATWHPRYTLAIAAEGVNEEQVLFADVTRDRTRYFKPATRARWDQSNINDDHDTPWREDYSVQPGITTGRLMFPDGALLLMPDGTNNLRIVTQDGVLLHDGVVVDQLQSRRHRVRAGRREGRWHQIRLRNRQGRLELRAVTVETIPGTRHEGAGD